MTPPSEHLGELKGIDPETYEALRNYPIYCSDDEALTVNLLESRNNILVMDALQGCIQRACEKRGWCFMVCNHIADVSTEKDIYDSEIHDYPAEALLAAYVAAAKEEKR